MCFVLEMLFPKTKRTSCLLGQTREEPGPRGSLEGWAYKSGGKEEKKGKDREGTWALRWALQNERCLLMDSRPNPSLYGCKNGPRKKKLKEAA